MRCDSKVLERSQAVSWRFEIGGGSTIACLVLRSAFAKTADKRLRFPKRWTWTPGIHHNISMISDTRLRSHCLCRLKRLHDTTSTWISIFNTSSGGNRSPCLTWMEPPRRGHPSCRVGPWHSEDIKRRKAPCCDDTSLNGGNDPELARTSFRHVNAESLNQEVLRLGVY